jgi:uncharacterized protein (DUF58 family)
VIFRRHSITLPGIIYIGITAFVMVAALNSGTNLLYITFGLMTGAFVASAFLSSLSLRRMDVRRIMADHVVAGEPSIIQYQVTNKKRFWPCFAVRIAEARVDHTLAEVPEGYSLHIAPGKSVNIMTRLVAQRRGVLHLSDIRLVCSFPFGFVNRTLLLRRPESIVVYPRIGALNRHLALRCRESTESGTMTSSVRRGNDEFYGLREYRAGDNIRSIHWRSTARTGQLTIREMACNAPPQMIVVLDLRHWREDPQALLPTASSTSPAPAGGKIERAIELAATLLCYAFIENFAVALTIAGSGEQSPPIPQMGRDARATLLHRLASLDAQRISPTSAFPFPNRLVGRAEFVVISLRSQDPHRDLLPPHVQFTLLALDSPEADTWVHFLSANETLRILRESSPKPPAIVPAATTR